MLKEDDFYSDRKRERRQLIEVFLLILISVSPLVPIHISLVLQAFLFMKSIKVIQKKDIKIILMLYLFFLMPVFLDTLNITRFTPYSPTNFMYPFIFLAAYFLAKKYDYDHFMYLFEKIMLFLATLSLIGMSLYFIAPSVILKLPTYNYNGSVHRTLLFFNYLFVGDWMAVRNSGIAWEPGVFQVLLNIALLTSLRQNKRVKAHRTIIYVLAIFFTKSTVGFFLLILNVLVLFKKDKRYIVPFFLIMGIFSEQIYSEALYQITYKLQGSIAFSGRFTPMINAFMYSWNKFFGIGATKYNQIYELYSIGSFDSYTQILMRFGYPLFIFIIHCIIEISRVDFVMGLIILISFTGEPLWGTVLFVTLYFICINEKKSQIGYNINMERLQ